MAAMSIACDGTQSVDSGADATIAPDAWDAADVMDGTDAIDAIDTVDMLTDASCPATGPLATGDPCSTPALTCQGRRFMCYSATLVGPVGTEQCQCVADRWSCTDTCAAWLAAMTDH